MAAMTAEALEARLSELGYDSLEANLRPLLALPGLRVEEWRACVGEIDSALAAGRSRARLQALRGKLLAGAGGFPEAQEAFRLALEADAGEARAWAWRGETRLLAGSVGEALADLDRAVALDPAYPWAYFHRAAARIAAGDVAAARADIAHLLGRDAAAPAGLAARALSGLLALQQGAPREALLEFDALAGALPAAAWPLVFRARARKALGDRPAVLRDLAAALERGGGVWVLLERSRLHEEWGDIDRALADVDAAAALDPRDAELPMRRAHLQTCRRYYHLAVPDYTRAIELSPGKVEAYQGRAMVQCIRNRMDEACADMRLAERLSGGDDACRLERLRMDVFAGGRAGTARELKALEAKRPEMRGEVRFLQGCHALKLRRHREAAASFERAREAARTDEEGLKAGFYRQLALGLAAPAEPALPAGDGSRGRLAICGLGIRPPFTATLEVLRAVSACGFVFNNLSEPEVASLLMLLAPVCEPTLFDVRGADSRWTKAIFREIRPGRAVAFVTRGHPMVCGGLAASLIEESKAQGVAYRVLGAVSSMDTLAVGTPPAGAAFPGTQVVDYSSVFEPHWRADTRCPTILYFNASVQVLERADYERFCDALESCWGPRRRVDFYGRSFHGLPDRIALAELRGFHGRIDPSYTLFIPPDGSGRD